MTCEYAAYLKLLLLCGYRDELKRYVDDALAAEEPLSDIVLELALAGSDDKKLLSVLNEYLRQAKDSDIDYDKAVFEYVLAFLRRKYVDESMPMKDITDLMYRLALCTERHLDEPWYTMYLMGDFFSDAEAGFIDKTDYRRRFEAFINGGDDCFDVPQSLQRRESFIKEACEEDTGRPLKRPRAFMELFNEILSPLL